MKCSLKSLFFVLISIGISNKVCAQSDSIYNKLSLTKIDSIFTDSVRKEFKIQFPIYKVYAFNDKAGEYLLVLTENNFKGNKHEFNDSIQAFHFQLLNGMLKLKWSFLDFKIGLPQHYVQEQSIWFWSKYISLKDLNNDGLIDPIIVFVSSSESNDLGDGRIKILCYFKNEKTAIRQQNGVTDYDRFCKVDRKFYQLPVSLQTHVKEMMAKMDENGVSIFPAGWEAAMKAKKTAFDEGY